MVALVQNDIILSKQSPLMFTFENADDIIEPNFLVINSTKFVCPCFKNADIV